MRKLTVYATKACLILRGITHHVILGLQTIMIRIDMIVVDYDVLGNVLGRM